MTITIRKRCIRYLKRLSKHLPGRRAARQGVAVIAAVLIVLSLVAPVVSGALTGPGIPQVAENGSNSTNQSDDSPLIRTGPNVNLSDITGQQSGPDGSENGTQNGTNNSSAPSSNESQNNSGSGGGLDPNLSLNGSIGNGSNNSSLGNGSNNSNLTNGSGSGSGSSGGGGGILSGLTDTVVDAGNQIFEGILQFLAQQGATVTNGLLSSLIDVASFTPTPGNADNYWRNPSDPLFQPAWEVWQNTARGLAFALNLVLTGLYFAWGLTNQTSGAYKAGRNKLVKSWAFFFIAWELMGASLSIVAWVGEGIGGITGGVPPDVINVGVQAVVLAAAVVLAWFYFWIVLVALAVFGLRIAILIALLPWIPVLYALSAFPNKGISGAAGGVTTTFWILLILPLPVVALLGVGFSADIAGALEQTGVAGAALTVGLNAGTLFGTVFLPYAMFQKAGAMGFGTLGVAGTAKQANRARESKDRQRAKLSGLRGDADQASFGNTRNFAAGARGNDPVENAPEGAYKSGASARSTARSYASPVTKRVNNVREKVRERRNGGNGGGGGSSSGSGSGSPSASGSSSTRPGSRGTGGRSNSYNRSRRRQMAQDKLRRNRKLRRKAESNRQQRDLNNRDVP